MQLPVWIEWLDRRIGSWGVPHIIRILVALNIGSFILDAFSPGFALSLQLDPGPVLAGEWWRVLTFLFASAFTPKFLGVLFFVFWLMFLWNIGEALEEAWSAFPLNLYIFIPWLLLTAVALGPWAQPVTNEYIAWSLLLAFATIYPDYEITLFPIPIPIKLKWVGVVVGGVALLTFIGQPANRLQILAGLANYFLFFGPWWYGEIKLRAESRARMRRFQGKDEDR
jgi:hypothetical protein